MDVSKTLQWIYGYWAKKDAEEQYKACQQSSAPDTRWACDDERKWKMGLANSSSEAITPQLISLSASSSNTVPEFLSQSATAIGTHTLTKFAQGSRPDPISPDRQAFYDTYAHAQINRYQHTIKIIGTQLAEEWGTETKAPAKAAPTKSGNWLDGIKAWGNNTKETLIAGWKLVQEHPQSKDFLINSNDEIIESARNIHTLAATMKSCPTGTDPRLESCAELNREIQHFTRAQPTCGTLPVARQWDCFSSVECNDASTQYCSTTRGVNDERLLSNDLYLHEIRNGLISPPPSSTKPKPHR